MANSKFSLDGRVFEGSTRQVILDHIMPVQEEVGVDTQIFPTPPGSPASQEEQGGQAADAPHNSVLECIMEDARDDLHTFQEFEQEEQGGQAADAPHNSVLECIMEDARDDLHTFQEFEHYSFGCNSGLDCDAPEDDLTDEMDIPSDEDQLLPVKLQGDQRAQKSCIWVHAAPECTIQASIPLDGKGHGQQDGPFRPEDYFPTQFDDNTKGDICKAQELEVEMLGMLPPDSSMSEPDLPDTSPAWPAIELASARNKQPYQPVSPGHDMVSESPDRAFKFTMADLNITTGNFSESHAIGQGGSGSVYQGKLKDGTMVVVKRIKKNDKNVLEVEDTKDFQTEADTLYKEKHVNLVRLLGFLEVENELILVTEYVTNGNLRQHLDGVPYGVILDMSKRCKISLDVVAALRHLHNQTKDDLDIIRRDIKSSDILITDDFCAKVAGFGLSRHSPFGEVGASSNSTQVKGTLGYMTLRHLTTHHLKEKNDVYSFGELLVEIFTGKQLVESSLFSDEYLTPRLGRLMDLIDPNITPTTFHLKILDQIFKLAASCLAPKESNCPTVEEVFWNLSLIVDPYFGDLKDESNSNKVQTSIQLDTQLEPKDSKQASRQASKLLIAKQDQTSLSFIDIIPDVFQLKSDETYFKMLQEEIAKLGYISRLLSQGDEFEQNLTNIGKTSFFLYFNEKDSVFEFYFKNYQGMASIIGVGLECAKVVLEDGWRVTIQEISKAKWDDAWNFGSSSSTMKVTILEPLERGMDNMEDSQEPLASIPRGQCLLLDLAQSFILKKAVASFLLSTSMTHANTGSGTSSSSSNQDIARSSSSSEGWFSNPFETFKNIFSSREASDQLKTKNGDGFPKDPPSDDVVKIDTTVHLKLLPGGSLFDGSNLLDATISDDRELKELTSQLDNTIYLEMMFKFLNEDDRKEIQVIVGPISFQFQEESEDNYNKSKQFGWYHKSLEVSFGPVSARYSEIGPNHSALDIVKVKRITTKGSSIATTCGTSHSMDGGVKASIPPLVTLSGGGSSGSSTSICVSDNVGDTTEKDFEETRGGFSITPMRNMPSSTLKYAYRVHDHHFEIDLAKLPYEDYRKDVLNLLPMCIPQDVKFEGTWHPKDFDHNPQKFVEYSLITSRVVHMTSKEIPKRVVKKSLIPMTMMCGNSKIPKESNEPLKFTQKYARKFFLNHAMTHLNGEKFKVREILHQRLLNEREPETHLQEERSLYAPQWRANPLVALNSELEAINDEL